MQYSFQKSRSRRGPTDGNSDFTALKKNLNLDDTKHKEELRALYTHFPCNISWYRQKIWKERILQCVFMIVSVAFLAAIPIVVYLLTQPDSDDGDRLGFAAANVTAQLTAVLTGLIAFHNFLSQWFVTRNGIASFHNASATLQTALYGFEDKWRDKDKGDDFKKAVDEQVAFARNVVSQEQAEYFNRLATIPQIDIGAALSTAGQAAVGIVGRHGYTTPQEKVAYKTSLDELKVKQALVEGIDKRLTELQEQLSKSKDDSEKNRLAEAIKSTETKQQQAELERIEASAELSKFT